MSQPFARGAAIPVPGSVDQSLGEFWVENPWDIVKKGHNLSAYERNRTWMNLGGRGFLDVSFLSGTDSDGDGRCAVAADFRNTGRMDLLVRQVGGGALLLFENQFPERHSLKVTLRGTKGNRQGVGARLEATVGGKRRVRELYPVNSYRSQGPNVVHFGLGDATRVEKLTVRWPSGQEQVLTDVAADRHIVVEEGNAMVEEVRPGETIRP